jgi:predicted nucleic acid-binding protein
VDAFDADVLIYAVIPQHPLGAPVRELILGAEPAALVGSVMLLPEVLVQPARAGRAVELRELKELLSRLEIHPVASQTSEFAVELAVRHRLKAIDATHLSTAVLAGADRFITNNRRDFGKDIDEIDIVYPDEL